MNRNLLTLSVLTLGLALASVASAQRYVRVGVQTSTCNSSRGGYGYGNGGYGNYGPVYGLPNTGLSYGSTYEESVLRGMAAYTRAVGQANYLNSQAAINLQQARTQQIANAQLKTETYFRMKEINTAAREAARPARLSTEGYVALAKRQAPDRLTELEYNRALGRLSWPAALQGADFAAEREILDKAFAARSPGDATSRFISGVRELTSTMQTRLQEQLSSLSPAQFIAGKKFLTSLAYEAQQPLVSASLASAE